MTDCAIQTSRAANSARPVRSSRLQQRAGLLDTAVAGTSKMPEPAVWTGQFGKSYSTGDSFQSAPEACAASASAIKKMAGKMPPGMVKTRSPSAAR